MQQNTLAITSPRRLIEERQRRQQVLPGMTDPGWFMLLGLLAAAESGEQLTVKDVIKLAFVPTSSAYRHMGLLVDEGLVERSADPNDGRQVIVNLTAKGAEAMAAYFHRKPGRSLGKRGTAAERKKTEHAR